MHAVAYELRGRSYLLLFQYRVKDGGCDFKNEIKK